MAELTDERVDLVRAAFAGIRSTDLATCLRAAAPFLQLPWDDVTEDEICEFGAISRDAKLPCSNAGVALAISNFVRRRNAALMPKPVDPRIAIVRHQLGGASMVHDLDGLAVKILHALDCDASQSDDHVG